MIKKIITASLVASSLMLGISVFADSQASFTFTNNTGGNVDDLHIEFNTAVNVTDKGPFPDLADNNTSKPTLSGAVVAAGGTAQIQVTGQAGKTNIKKWWWTRGGVPVGGEHKKCAAPDCTSP